MDAPPANVLPAPPRDSTTESGDLPWDRGVPSSPTQWEYPKPCNDVDSEHRSLKSQRATALRSSQLDAGAPWASIAGIGTAQTQVNSNASLKGNSDGGDANSDQSIAPSSLSTSWPIAQGTYSPLPWQCSELCNSVGNEDHPLEAKQATPVRSNPLGANTSWTSIANINVSRAQANSNISLKLDSSVGGHTN